MTTTKERLREILDGHARWVSGDGGCRANLRGADLSDANLRGADLSDANLRYANLRGAKLPHFQIPDGVLVGHKKLFGGFIATLEIPKEARRTATPVGRKCRAEYARVVDIDGAESAESLRGGITYRVGEVVYPDWYDDDIRVECTNGIHFYLTRAEAEEH